MNLNLTNLKDLEHICQIARDGLNPAEEAWRLRINQYQQRFRTEIDRQLETEVYPELDSSRKEYPFSGILVRARLPDGTFDSVDIAHLNKESLFAWLRSRGGNNEWAENTVALLLGHEVGDETEPSRDQ